MALVDHEPGIRASRAALALAAGHLVEAAVAAHRFSSHGEVAARLGLSRSHLSSLVGLTALAPDVQCEVLDLRGAGALGRLSERTLSRVVAAHADWNIQRWWWSLLAQPFDPDWLVDGLPARSPFPSGRRCRPGDRAVGDLALPELAALVARRNGPQHPGGCREALFASLADGGAGAPRQAAIVTAVTAMSAATLAAEFERLHGYRPRHRHPDYLRRRVAWAVQAAKLGGLPKPISGRVMELRDQLPERWREVFAEVERVHVTRAHRIERCR